MRSALLLVNAGMAFVQASDKEGADLARTFLDRFRRMGMGPAFPPRYRKLTTAVKGLVTVA